MFKIRKAERQQIKARVGLFGNSGSGKTLGSLLFAYGLAGEDWSKICVIDTEYGRSEAYADRGEFSVLQLEAPYTPDRYIKAIEEVENAGFEIIIIDSISHLWVGKGGILEMADKMGASAAKWSTLTPLYQKFVDKIQSCSAHVICCGRTKESIAMNKVNVDGKEKTVIEKVPMKLQMKDGFDFEMLISFFLSEDHLTKVEKDNTGLFDGNTFIVSKDQGLELRDWIIKGTKSLSKTEIKSENFNKYFKSINSVKTEKELNEISNNMKAEIGDGKLIDFFGEGKATEIIELLKEKKEKMTNSSKETKTTKYEPKNGGKTTNETKTTKAPVEK